MVTSDDGTRGGLQQGDSRRDTGCTTGTGCDGWANGGARTENVLCSVLTDDVSQESSGWLKLVAFCNMRGGREWQQASQAQEAGSSRV